MSASALFPYGTIRAEQDELLRDVYDAVSSRACLIAHAPTGLGKTAASLAPALKYAIDEKKTVFFLTSRHTQHAIAVETLRLIKQKHKVQFGVVDLVGKKHMCARDDIAALFSNQFHEYCRSLRETDGCNFYLNFKKGGELSSASKMVLAVISSQPAHTEETVSLAKKQGVCPYEVAAAASKDASVIVADYYYMFNPRIRENFLKRNGKSLEDAILIIDEGHNLPDRMREMLTQRLTTVMIERAIKEAQKWGETAIVQFLTELGNALSSLSGSEERVLTKAQLVAAINGYDISVAIEKMSVVAESIREAEQQSFIGSIADFLAAWQGGEEGYARILNAKQGPRGKFITLSYQCLDPAIEAQNIIRQSHSVILMSGTLTPTFMYRDLLGFPEGTVQKEYRNPLPKENRLALIVPSVTTKFSRRSQQEYEKIAQVCAAAANAIPGNVAIFFPSYSMMNEIHPLLHEQVMKKVVKEQQDLSKEEKKNLLQEFKHAYLTGAMLLAVIGGNFSEGIDLPGDLLRGVIIVGLPLGQPDLQTKELIRYYDGRYGKGWDYGYVFPAFTKAMQSAGRCIRTETDRGVILFVDERYAWDRYYSCFPKDWGPKMTGFYQEAIGKFFENKRE